MHTDQHNPDPGPHPDSSEPPTLCSHCHTAHVPRPRLELGYTTCLACADLTTRAHTAHFDTDKYGNVTQSHRHTTIREQTQSND